MSWSRAGANFVRRQMIDPRPRARMRIWTAMCSGGSVGLFAKVRFAEESDYRERNMSLIVQNGSRGGPYAGVISEAPSVWGFRIQALA